MSLNVIYIQQVRIYWKFQNLSIDEQTIVLYQNLGPELWNSLPQSLRSCASLGSFKKQLKTYLFRHAYETES